MPRPLVAEMSSLSGELSGIVLYVCVEGVWCVLCGGCVVCVWRVWGVCVEGMCVCVWRVWGVCEGMCVCVWRVVCVCVCVWRVVCVFVWCVWRVEGVCVVGGEGYVQDCAVLLYNSKCM